MAVKFGVLVPQGWHLDLEDIKDPAEQFEAARAAAEALSELAATSTRKSDT